MPQQVPRWWRAVEAAEAHEDLRRLHRADGRVTADEDAAERSHLRLVVLAAAVEAAECCEIGQAAMRVGPETPYVRRKLAARERRLAGVVPFPGDRYGAGEGDAVMQEVA